MILTLEVIGEHAADLGAGGRQVFDAIGGTIGRLSDNDWVLPDPYVSGRHALIRYLNGKFFVEDTSTNGIYLNTPHNRLARAQPHPLQDGDLLFVDTYQIKVTIHGEQTVLHSREVPAQQSVPYYPEDHTASLALAPEDEETEWFGLSEEKPAPRVEPAVQPRFEATSASAPASKAAPQHSRKVGEARRSESTGDIRNVPSANAHGDDAKLQVLLSAAGLNGISVSNELAQTLGKMLRVAVGGLMDVLRSRERMKDEIRMRGTTFKPAHNNPLKFSANVDDAFHNLLVKHNPAYLAPPDALEDAFRDVRDHQTATLAAMRLAFESMLAQFDPEQLQEDFDRQLKKGAMLGVPAKLRYWDLYRDKYGDTVKDAEAAFRTLFSEQFASAYEEQLNRLKARAHSYDKDGGPA